MKKLTALSIALGATLFLNGQVTVTTKSFELESQNKHKGWNIIDAGRDATTNRIFIKFGQPVCDESKSAWTGVRTYRGLKWTIDKLYFDDAFSFVSTDSKSYNSSEEAIVNDEYVFGKTFMPTMAGSVGGALLSGAGLPAKPITNAFMFTNIIVPSVSITGFKIITSGIGCQPLAKDTKTKGTLCGEIPVAETIHSEDAKQEKGQRWIPLYNNPEPNGGNIMFATSGVNPDPNKSHYVFRKYAQHGTVIKEMVLNFDYQALPSVKEIEVAPGKFDYIVIVAPFFYKKSKQPTTNPLRYEYIRINGETFDIKERIPFTAVYAKWMVENIVEKDGAVYLMGQCTDSKEKYTTFDLYSFKEMNGYQVMKVNNGKVDYIKGFNKADGQSALKTVQGLKGKAEVSFVLNGIEAHVVNGRIIVSGQSIIDIGNKGNDRDAMVTMVFAEDGTLSAYIAKPEKTYSKGNVFFSKDGNQLFWIIQDVDTYNDIIDENVGTIIAKKYKHIVANIGVVKVDLSKNEVGAWQSLESEEWGINYMTPLLYDSDTEIVMLGRKLTKKAKESEVVFVTIKK